MVILSIYHLEVLRDRTRVFRKHYLDKALNRLQAKISAYRRRDVAVYVSQGRSEEVLLGMFKAAKEWEFEYTPEFQKILTRKETK